MSAAHNMNAYLNNHYRGMTPEELIHLLFKGALKHLKYAREGVIEKDPKKRGEHLSKVIAIVSELNTSIDPNMNDESTQFLRGLYASILTELPKVSITNKVKTIDLATTYISKLNEIWETQVLTKPAGASKPAVKKPVGGGLPGGYGNPTTQGPKSIFA